MLLTLKKYNLYSTLPILLCLPLIFLDLKLAAGGLAVSLFILVIVLIYYKNNPTFTYTIIAALILRVLLLIINEYIPFLPLQPDALHYSAQAMKIVENRTYNLPLFYDIPYSMSVKSYSFFLSLFYSFFGKMPFFASIVNVILGILSSLLIYKIAKLVFNNEKIAFNSMLVSLFLPSIIAFTSYVLRDTLVMLLTLNMIWFILLFLYKGHSITHGLLALVFFVLVGILRIQNFYLYTVFFILFTFILVFSSRSKLLLKFTVSFLLVCILFFLILRYNNAIMTIITYPMRAKALRAQGGSAYLVGMQYHSLIDFLIYLPIRFIYFSFGPFLWNAGGGFQLLTALEGIIVFIAFILTVQYIIKRKPLRMASPESFLLIFCFVGIAANAIVDSNFGTAVRHRMMYIIFFFMFAAAQIKNIKLKFF